MSIIVYGAAFAFALAVGVLVLLEVGRRVGVERIKEEGDAASKGFGAIEGAVFALLGLILAFSFSGALTRFDMRRDLAVQEANAIGTAWLRLDVLPTAAQPAVRDLFRRYVDVRIETFRKVPDMDAVRAELAQSARLQQEIWNQSVSGCRTAEMTAAPVLLLPALNEMIDITTTRTEAARLHPPLIIFAMLGALTLVCSLFAGYDMASRGRLNMLHSAGFAVVLAVTVYVIVDLEYPRVGLIKMTDSDEVLVQLRASMQ